MTGFRVTATKAEMALTAAEMAIGQARGWRRIAEEADTDAGEAAERKADALDLANLANEQIEAAYASLWVLAALGLEGVQESYREVLVERADRARGRLDCIWERVAAETGQAG
jgi:hypothetical protein